MDIRGIASDSREVKRGELFVAINGLHHDAASYVDEAIARGAVFAVAERPVRGIPSLVVEDARLALARLFDAWYGHPARGMKLIGVTGTNGKTSVSTMLYSILTYAGRRCGMIGTVKTLCRGKSLCFENSDRLANMTTPDPSELYRLLLEMRHMGAEYVIMEVTSHALALSKVEPLFFHRAIFTNLTPDHLDLHGDMESYFLEKKKLFSRCEQAVISCFGAYGQRLAEELECGVRLVGEEQVCNVQKRGEKGVSFMLTEEGVDLLLPVPGDFSVENGALAAVTAHSLGVGVDVIKEALAHFSGVPGRMERITGDRDDIHVFLDYAHTPDALQKLLTTVRGFRSKGNQILLLFGCGGDRDRSKRREMGRIASRLADLSIITSDNSRSEDPQDIISDILKGVDKEKPYIVIEDRREAIAYAVRTARAGDILLLAGKGHEEYEIVGNERRPFSERALVASCLAQRERTRGHEG